MTTKAVTCAADVPHTTGLRWQQTLIDEDLVERGPQEHHIGRTLLRLTKHGRTLMDAYFTRLFYEDRPLPFD